MPVLAIHSTEIFKHCFSPEMREKRSRAREREKDKEDERKKDICTYVHIYACTQEHT
jgi:hypothetical protein